MPSAKMKPRSPHGTAYRGKQARTGNSSGFRFEGALFRSHPEFQGEVEAHVLAPGRLLVLATEPRQTEQIDPVMSSFLAFLAQDIANAPHGIASLDQELASRIDRLTEGVDPSTDEEIGGEVSL